MKLFISNTRLASFIAILSFIATSSFAYDFKIDEIYYNLLSESTVEVTYGEGYSGAVTIPSTVTYDGIVYSVTSIGNSAFTGCTSLTTITIPNSVTSIGNSAFTGCTSLPSITIPNSVTSIGNSAFTGCTSFPSITIPNSITSIGNSAFSGCTNLTEVNYNAVNCSSMGSGNYPVFSGCTNFKVLNIGAEVEKISSTSFTGCDGLNEVNITDLSAWCKIDFDLTYRANPLYYANTLKLNGTEITDLVIPNDITQIKDVTFCGCTSLTTITIPNSVTSIGYSAFYGCDGLNEVNITDLSAWFKIEFGNTDANPLYYANTLKLNGTEITDLVIPNDITQIKNYAILKCDGLTSITIPNSVTSIGDYAFTYCNGLTEINIPGSVASIGKDVFSHCDGLTTITIPNSVTSIGDYAFSYCNGLTEINIPGSVTSIGESAFSHCDGLTTITIPNSVTTIGDFAFGGVDYLTVNITDLSAWCKIDFRGISVRGYTLKLNGTEITDLVIPNDITLIKHCAFHHCTSLTSVTIPNSVTYIESYAFDECFNLTKLNIGNSVTTLSVYAFSNCKGLTSITIPQSVTYIGGGAFEGCGNITSITVLNPEPPMCGEFDPFENYNCLLTVPEGSREYYRSAKWWRKFQNITETAGIEAAKVDATETEEIGRYDIYGRLLSEPLRGINIIKMSDGSTRKEYVK